MVLFRVGQRLTLFGVLLFAPVGNFTEINHVRKSFPPK